MAMDALLPSEIARMVYGYLLEERCTEAAKLFLKESSNLEECRQVLSVGRHFSTRVCGLTLLDVLEKFCLLNTIVQEKLENFDKLDKLRHCSDLTGQIKVLFEEYKGKNFIPTVNTATQSSPSLHLSPPKNRKRRIFSNNEEDKAKKIAQEFNEEYQDSPSKSVEATPLKNLPGYTGEYEFEKHKKLNSKISESNLYKSTPQKNSVSHNVHLQNIQKSHENIPLQGIEKDEILIKKRCPNINKDLNVHSENITKRVDTEVQTELYSVTVLDKNIMTETVQKTCTDTEVQTSDISSPESEVEVPEILGGFTEKLINRSEVVEKLVENINTVLKPIKSNLLEKTSNDDSYSKLIIAEINKAIEAAANKTQNDPEIMDIINEIVLPTEQNFIANKDQLHNQCDVSYLSSHEQKRSVSEETVSESSIEKDVIVINNNINEKKMIESKISDKASVNPKSANLEISGSNQTGHNVDPRLNRISRSSAHVQRIHSHNSQITVNEDNNVRNNARTEFNSLDSLHVQKRTINNSENVFTPNNTITSTPIKTYTAIENYGTCDWFSTQDLPMSNTAYYKEAATKCVTTSSGIYSSNEAIGTNAHFLSPITSKDENKIVEKVNCTLANTAKDQTLHTPDILYPPKINTAITVNSNMVPMNSSQKNKTPTLQKTSELIEQLLDIQSAQKLEKNIDNMSSELKDNNSNDSNKFFNVDSIMLYGVDSTSSIPMPMHVQEIECEDSISLTGTGLSPFLKVIKNSCNTETSSMKQYEKTVACEAAKPNPLPIASASSKLESNNSEFKITENSKYTPKKFIESRPKTTKKSLSTPKKPNSYIRALNFDTPMNRSQSESKVNNTDSCLSLDSLKKSLKNACKSSLFQSPPFMNSEENVEQNTKAKVLPTIPESIELTESESKTLTKDSSFANKESTVKSVLASKKSWDTDLRKYLGRNENETSTSTPTTTSSSKKRSRSESSRKSYKKSKKNDKNTPKKEKKSSKKSSKKSKRDEKSETDDKKKEDTKVDRRKEDIKTDNKKDVKTNKEKGEIKSENKKKDVETVKKKEEIKSDNKKKDCETVKKKEEIKSENKKKDCETIRKKEEIKSENKKKDCETVRKKEEIKSDSKKKDCESVKKKKEIKSYYNKEDNKADKKKLDIKTDKKKDSFKDNEKDKVKTDKKAENIKSVQKDGEIRANKKKEEVESNKKTEHMKSEIKKNEVIETNSFLLEKIEHDKETSNNLEIIQKPVESISKVNLKNEQTKEAQEKNGENNPIVIDKREMQLQYEREENEKFEQDKQIFEDVAMEIEIEYNDNNNKNELEYFKEIGIESISRDVDKNDSENSFTDKKEIELPELIMNTGNTEDESVKQKKDPLVALLSDSINDEDNEVQCIEKIASDEMLSIAKLKTVTISGVAKQNEVTENVQEDEMSQILENISNGLTFKIISENSAVATDNLNKDVPNTSMKTNSTVDYVKLEEQMSLITNTEVSKSATKRVEVIYDEVSKVERGKIVKKKYARLKTLQDFSVDFEIPGKDEDSLQVPPTPQVLSPGSCSLMLPISKMSDDSRTFTSFVATPLECPKTPNIVITPEKGQNEHTSDQMIQQKIERCYQLAIDSAESSKKPEITQFEVIKENLLKNSKSIMKTGPKTEGDKILAIKASMSYREKQGEIPSETNDTSTSAYSNSTYSKSTTVTGDSVGVERKQVEEVEDDENVSEEEEDSEESSDEEEEEEEEEDEDENEDENEDEEEDEEEEEVHDDEDAIGEEGNAQVQEVADIREKSPAKVFSINKTDEELAEFVQETPAKDGSCIEAEIFDTPNISKPIEQPTNLNTKITQMMILKDHQNKIVQIRPKPKIISVKRVLPKVITQPPIKLIKAHPKNMQLLEIKNEMLALPPMSQRIKIEKSEEEIAMAIKSIENQKFNKSLDETTLSATPSPANKSLDKSLSKQNELAQAIESLTRTETDTVEQFGSDKRAVGTDIGCTSEENVQLVLEDNGENVEDKYNDSNGERKDKDDERENALNSSHAHNTRFQSRQRRDEKEKEQEKIRLGNCSKPCLEIRFFFDEENYKRKRRKGFSENDMRNIIADEEHMCILNPTQMETIFDIKPKRKKPVRKAKIKKDKNLKEEEHSQNSMSTQTCTNDSQSIPDGIANDGNGEPTSNKHKRSLEEREPLNKQVVKKRKKNIFVY